MSVQLIPNNQRKGRRFSPQQKLQILKGWELSGNCLEIAQRYQLHPMTLYRWRKALQRGAETFLSGKRPRKDARIKELEEENRKLNSTVI
jgi:transposase-like protein